MMALFNRHRSNDDLGLPDEDTDTDGRPDGIDPPPAPRLADIDWDADVAENARLAIPQPGFPSRPLPFEESAVKLFDADMRECTKWGNRQRALLPSLHETASARRLDLREDCDRLDREIAAAQNDVESQREQLDEQDRRFPQGPGAVDGLLIAGMTLGAGLETITLQPVIGEIFTTQDWKAWCFAAFAVGAIGYSSWQFGGLLHRWLAYEGPVRVRRTLGWKALGFAVFAVLALIAVVAIRLLARNDEVTSWQEAAFGGCLYAAVQGLVQLAAMTHGWRHDNPRVKELANTEAHLTQLRSDREMRDDDLGDATAWAESLNEFHVSAWLTEHRAQLAADYAAADLAYRNDLGQALIAAGHDESASMLLILPLPTFVPPAESDPDDTTEWVNGFMLPL
ncbi:hypothetical protein [Gordonia sp. HS-NH1]|uniref:hypothetical protein n=1 Tax=Gordonia sp. HS-NH1 TaxID=1435068 RepID=UPI0006E2A5B6|nr:hypothetical protein [Gordonia sp. HS-NH1]